MIAQEIPVRSSRRAFLTIAQLVVSLGGAFLSLIGIAFVLISDRYLQAQTGLTRVGAEQTNPLVGLLILLGISCIPSIVLSIRWLKGIAPREIQSNRWTIASSFLMVIWAGAVLAGAFLLESGQAKTLQVVTSLFVVGLPLICLLGFALRKIKFGSWKRFWGVVTGTLYITLPLIIILEGMILLAAIMAASTVAVANPGFQDLFSQLSQLSTSTQEQMDQLLNQLAPLFTSSQVLYAVFFAFGLLIPLVEEFFKPLLVWLFVRRRLTPAEGFAIGLISGAAFALVESLFALNATMGSDYYAISLGRAGTGLLHTFTAGMMGWALASTWRDGKGLRIGLVYGSVVLLHGTWNSFALMLGFGSLPVQLPGLTDLGNAVPWVLALLAVWMLTILYVMNRKLQGEESKPQPTFTSAP